MASRGTVVGSRAAVEPARLSLRDAALAYECAVLEVSGISEEAKVRALKLLANKIVPLVGPLAFDDLADVHLGVRSVLEAELEAECDRAVLVVWEDFVRWSRRHLGPPVVRWR